MQSIGANLRPDHNVITIEAHQRDQTEVQVTCSDTGVLRELYEFFSFLVPGYKFMPAFRNKLWDGKVRLFNSRNNTLPYGLLFHLSEFCKTRGYEFKTTLMVPPLDPIEIDSFISRIPLMSNTGQSIQAREYQLNAFRHGVSNHRAVLISPTGSGKSLIIYLLIRWFLERSDQKAIIIVPTTSLCHQLYQDFSDYSAKDDTFSIEDRANIIMSGYTKEPKNRRLKVTMEDGSHRYLAPNELVTTKTGDKLAKDLTLKDELV